MHVVTLQLCLLFVVVAATSAAIDSNDEIEYIAAEATKFLTSSNSGCYDCPEHSYSLYKTQYIHKEIKKNCMYGASLTFQHKICYQDGDKKICRSDVKHPFQECIMEYSLTSDSHGLIIKNVKCAQKNRSDVISDVKRIRTEDQSLFSSYARFLNFLEIHNRRYSLGERIQRFQIFHKNMLKARILNQLDFGTATYGQSPFADMTEKEFRHTRLSPTLDQSMRPPKLAKISLIPPPTSFDWRQHNAVTKVKNQGSCGSCWAFSTTGNIEGQWAIRKGHLVSLSEQELLDCDTDDRGCGGGYPKTAYNSIMFLGGLESESEYPYEARIDQCKLSRSNISAYINGSVSLPKDERQLAAWLAQNGPISIAINAYAMQFYTGGISHPWNFVCDPRKLDHAVLLVGYGINGTTPYWIVKNSWGPTWGEQGYYLVYRGAGVCGLNLMATSSIVN